MKHCGGSPPTRRCWWRTLQPMIPRLWDLWGPLAKCAVACGRVSMDCRYGSIPVAAERRFLSDALARMIFCIELMSQVPTSFIYTGLALVSWVYISFPESISQLSGHFMTCGPLPVGAITTMKAAVLSSIRADTVLCWEVSKNTTSLGVSGSANGGTSIRSKT